MERFECAYDELVPLHDLRPHPKNTNEHPRKQIELLAEIIKYQGQRLPIVVSKQSGYITKGHGRLAALQELGWTNGAVDYQDYADEVQEYADMEADNRIAELAERDEGKFQENLKLIPLDFDLRLMGAPDLKRIEVEQVPGCDEDEVPDVLKESKVKKGDLYQLGNHRLMCGDSTMIDDVEKLMGGEMADMVFTDPPYGINICGRGSFLDGGKKKGRMLANHNTYHHFEGDLTGDEAKDFFTLVSGLTQGTLIFWGANNYPEILPKSEGWIVWDKKEDMHDTFSDCEIAYTNFKKPIKKFKHIWRGLIKDSERGEKRVHPTQKPIALAEWCFENYGNPKTVLDGFGGSGSTLVACEKTNRRCFMMEVDPHYCQVIIERYLKFTGREDVSLLADDRKIPLKEAWGL